LGHLSRERVVEAAVEMARQSGFEELTIAALAERPGAAQISPSRHMRDRDALVEEVVERLLATA
jgi:AcrR family transcriptional regulator